MSQLFDTIYGSNLVGELDAFAPYPYVVVTMDDLWPQFEAHFGARLQEVVMVESLSAVDLEESLRHMPSYASVIGLGGGQALDVAKFYAWRGRSKLFQVPTSMSVNAAFGHRAGLRRRELIEYVGWAIPEAVYIDYDVIQAAPSVINNAGVGDILCYHTALWDWAMADRTGNVEPKWPWDDEWASQSQSVLKSVIDNIDAIRNVTPRGIRTLMEAHRWGGAAFHNAGWNPRPIEGAEHFFFYSLEEVTGKKFLHGQPVCLGILLMSALQENEPEYIRSVIERAGVSYRPSDMGVSWEDVRRALERLPGYVEEAGLWYTIASHRAIGDEFVTEMEDWLGSSP